MIDPIDIEHSKYEIAKAEARLAYQRHIAEDTRRYIVYKQCDTIQELQSRLAYALARHASLLEELSAKLEAIDDKIDARVSKV